jgi:hypothetical protein
MDGAFCTRENKTGIRPGKLGFYPLIALSATMRLEDSDGTRAYPYLALFASLRGRDTRFRARVSRAPDGDGWFTGCIKLHILPAQSGELALAHPRAQGYYD